MVVSLKCLWNVREKSPGKNNKIFVCGGKKFEIPEKYSKTPEWTPEKTSIYSKIRKSTKIELGKFISIQ